MNTPSTHEQRVDAIVADLEAAQKESALARRKHIEECVAAGDCGDEQVQVGLEAFHDICDHWAVGEKTAEAILLADDESNISAEASTAQLVERLSYVLRIHQLMAEVIQGDQAQHQRWIRRSNLALDGHRPIDLMTSGRIGRAKVMEYLEFCQRGHCS